jgi:hypothetical protein
MPLRLLSTTLSFSLPAILSLLLQVQFVGLAHPPVWPDEVLFSNPAAELARGEGFRTEVLEGLIPGMEEATLWNSPLYMVLLSGVYYLGEESLTVGRALSLVIAMAILVAMTAFLLAMNVDRAIVFLAPLLLSLDPTFVRGANVIRMDGLCLLFCMLALYFAYFAFKRNRDHYSFLAGVFLGLAAISHPAALYGVFPVFIFHIFRWRGLFFVICGVTLALTPWLAYIADHPEIFEIQFVSQLMRKSGLLSFWGGPTGGIFVVFTSQFGGGAVSMLLAAVLCLGGGTAMMALWLQWISKDHSGRKDSAANLRHRATSLFKENGLFLLSLTWPAVTAFCLLSVEGWYAMHSFPYLILSSAAIFSSPVSQQKLRRIGLRSLQFTGLTLLVLSAVNTWKIHSGNRAEIIERALSHMTRQTASCQSVYVRMVPDPYFRIKEARPGTRYFEFTPARLQFNVELDRKATFDRIQCFLLEGSGAQDGAADEYLRSRADEFDRKPMAFSAPATSGNLYIRREKF